MTTEVSRNHNDNVILISSESEDDQTKPSCSKNYENKENHNEIPDKGMSVNSCDNISKDVIIANGHGDKIDNNDKVTRHGSETPEDNCKDGRAENDIPSTSTRDCSTTDHLLEKFIVICKPLMLEEHKPERIIKLLRSRHQQSQDDFKSSANYCNVLQRYMQKLEKGSNRVLEFISDLITLLSQYSKNNNKRSASNGTSSSSQKQHKRMKLTSVILPESEETETQNNESESSNSQMDDSNESGLTQKDIDLINHLELLLKKLSDEIKKLQAHELTLDEMDDDDSMYIQEAKLKAKSMKVFEKICQLKNVPVKTGRVIERSIKITSSRFPEINKKVEAFVNRKKSFPDLYEVTYLVKQANKKQKLQLSQSQVKTISEHVFKDVGEELQHRRHYDFVYNFGSYLTDPKTETNSDPANSNLELHAKLKENRKQAKSNLQEVIEKYTKKQEENDLALPVDVAAHTNAQDVASGSETDYGSEPPSDNEVKSDDESEESEDGGEDSEDIIEIKDNSSSS